MRVDTDKEIGLFSIPLVLFVLIIILVFPASRAVNPNLPNGSKGPAINDVEYSPLFPTPRDTLNISADVTDPDGVKSVYISYCNKTNCFLPAYMKSTGGDAYSGQIDLSVFYPGDVIGFEVNADDSLGNANITQNYTVTIMKVPNSIELIAFLSRGMCGPGDNITVNGTAAYDNGAPAIDANISVTVSKSAISWDTKTGNMGDFKLNFSAPKNDGNYNISVRASAGNFTGFAKKSLRVTSIPTAPDFDFTDIDGNRFRLADYRGKDVVLLDFMSLPCTSCKKIEDALLAIYLDYGGRARFISIDILPTDTDLDLRNHRDAKNISWTVARAPSGIVDTYGVYEIPVIVIINRDGYITYMEKGILSSDDNARSGIIKTELDKALEGGQIITPPIEAGYVVLAVSMGVVAFFSPCSFPLMPGYVSYYLGLSKTGPGEDGKDDADSRKKKRRGNLKFAVKGGAASAFGLLTVFILVGALIIWLGNVIAGYTKHIDLIIGIAIILLGALMLTNLQYYSIINPIKSAVGKAREKIGRKKRDDGRANEPGAAPGKKAGALSLFGYGIGYGAASLGCTLPAFIAILLAGIESGGVAIGLLVLLAFAVTASVLMIAITLLVAGFEMALMQKLKAATPYIKKASGVILLAVGVYLLYYYWTVARFL